VSWNGKIIGALIGLASGLGPIGALVGAVVGHQFDTAGSVPPQPGPEAAARVQELLFPALFRVMGHVAKADGRISEREIAAARMVMGSLRLGPGQVQQAIGYFGEGKEPGFSLERTLAELQPLLRTYPQVAQFFLEIELQAALAGNDLAPAPRARLVRAANLLGLDDGDFQRLELMMRWRMGSARSGGSGQGGPGAAPSAAYQAERVRQAYALLEVEPTISDEALTKAYRRLMSRNHPDKLQGKGLPEAMLERAKERTQQIQAAWEQLRTQRGMR
jgi:DnaJ like chaperone protein